MKPITKTVRKYMADIGRKGGQAGKGTEWRREVCKHAAIVRWRAYRERKQQEAEKAEAKQEAEAAEKETVAAQTPEVAVQTPEEQICEASVDSQAAMQDIPA
jgi:hypothetical protein